jgi:acyl transferase domain-containing protein/acyl carrier protein
VGIGSRVRGAAGPSELWSLLRRGEDTVGLAPARGWEDIYDPDPFAIGKSVSRFGSFLNDVEGMDWRFFGVSPREARSIDPQHRLLLEVAWEALEDAGMPVSQAAGNRAGVFVGIMLNDYGRLSKGDLSRIDGYTAQNNTFAYAANRISFFFDLHGPSMAIDTNCSGSLLAIHQACRSVWTGESEWALAGGVSLILAPDTDISMSKATALSPTGRVRTWDSKADGFVRGEGAGLVLVKPLASALANGDRIYALVLGTAANHKGRSNWIVEPSESAQREVILDACAMAGIGPEEIDYVELHGTGTPKGDPVEAAALGDVMALRPAERPCSVGSIKTNLGHLDAAAGVAGLIKAALCVHRRQLVPSLHFETCNPAIDLERLKLRVQTTVSAWPRRDVAPVAGVTSIGFGGTNVHALLKGVEQPSQSSGRERMSNVLALSARSNAALSDLKERFAAWLESDECAGDMVDVCHTVSVRRTHHACRLAVSGESPAEIATELRSSRHSVHDSDTMGTRGELKAPQVVFVFPGHGPQWLGMARDLLRTDYAFAEVIASTDALVRQNAGWSVLDELEARPEHSRLDEPEVVQPVLFSIAVALAALWRQFGIAPDAVVGHSFGEIAAAVTAGPLTLEEGVRIVCARGRVTQRRSGHGGVAVVELPSEAVRIVLGSYASLEVAGENTATSTLVTGSLSELDQLLADLAARDVFARRVKLGYASHGRDMDAVLGSFAEEIGILHGYSGSVPFYSAVDGRAVQGTALDVNYWLRNLRQPVRFAEAVRAIGDSVESVFLEISPHPVLLSAIRENLQGSERLRAVLPSLQRGKPSQKILDESLGRLYEAGCDPNWSVRYPEGRVVSTPTYPWQRERMWVHAADRSVAERDRPHPLLGSSVKGPTPRTLVWEQKVGGAETAYFRDHCLQGVASLSTSAMVEMIVAAASRTLGTEAIEILDLELRRALLLPREGEYIVQTILTRGEGWTAEVRGRSNAPNSSWRTHSTALVRIASSTPPVAPLFDFPLSNRLSSDAAYRELANLGLQYGPMFQAIDWLSRKDGGVFACVRMPQGLDPQPYFFHPALHDAAMHVTVLAETCQGHSGFVPIRIHRIWVRSRPEMVLRTHATVNQFGSGMVANLRVENINGDIVEIIEGIELVHLDDAILSGEVTPEEASWLYSVEWTALPRPEAPVAASPDSKRQRPLWLILADRQGIGAALAERARASGVDTLVLTSEALTRDVSGAQSEEDRKARTIARTIASARAAGASLSGVVNLWSLDLPDVEAVDPDGIDSAMTLSCDSAVRLLQGLEEAVPDVASPVWHVTRGAQPWALKAAEMAPLQAPLWGLARAVAAELPARWGGLVDLDPTSSAAENASKLWAWLNAPQVGEDEVLFRQGEIFGGRLVRRSSTEHHKRLEFNASASYVVTGGTGGLGLTVARWLATKGVKHLVLAARTPLPARDDWSTVALGTPLAETIAALREIEALGAAVHVVSLDVADHRAVIEFINDHDRRGRPPIRGLFHLAGNVEIEETLQMSTESLLVALRPKVHGTLALHRWFEDLDLLVLFSSASSIVRSPRLGHYAAGNAFLDAMAHYRRARGQAAISIDWGLWSEVGYIRSLGGRGPGAMRGMKSMAPEAGIRVLEHLVESGDVQTVVWPADWEEWARLYPSFARTSLIAHLTGPPEPEAVETMGSASRSPLDPAPGTDRASALTDHVAREIAARLRLPVEALALDLPLEHLGFDSLLATELQAKLRRDLGVRIPVMRLLGFSSVRTIAEEVVELVESSRSQLPPPMMESDQRMRAAARATDAPPASDKDEGDDGLGRVGS